MRNDVTMEDLIMTRVTDGIFGIYPVINNFNAVIDKDFVDEPFLPDDPEILMATGMYTFNARSLSSAVYTANILLVVIEAFCTDPIVLL